MAIDSFRGPNRWLSNFYLIPVEMDGTWYPSTEHAYQAAKTLDPQIRSRFQCSGLGLKAREMTAGEAKAMGRTLNGQRADWHRISLGIMKDLCLQKFRDNKDLRAKLLATGNEELIEGNNWDDNFWGCVRNKETGQWVGENHLGKILMEVRSLIRVGQNALGSESAYNSDPTEFEG